MRENGMAVYDPISGKELKRFRKGIAILLCALMLFPLLNMTPVKATGLAETESQAQNEMEGQEETSEKTMPGETAGIQSITLHAGAGTLEGNTSVSLLDGKLPELPVLSRTGWTFRGWYTEVDTEDKISMAMSLARQKLISRVPILMNTFRIFGICCVLFQTAQTRIIPPRIQYM